MREKTPHGQFSRRVPLLLRPAIVTGATESTVTSDPKLPLESGAIPAPVEPRKRLAKIGEPLLADPVRRPQSALQLWMHRTSVFLFVLISAIAGVLLVILPWTPEWTDNYLLLSYPWLRTLISTGFFRGLCSGLGLLDIWIGFWEALHYHDH
jgi:hypothetical protein